jgi:hypothetical protein
MSAYRVGNDLTNIKEPLMTNREFIEWVCLILAVGLFLVVFYLFASMRY